MPKLLEWSKPLLAVGGELVAIKGANAAKEMPSPKELARQGWSDAEILTAGTVPGATPTTVVRLKRLR